MIELVTLPGCFILSGKNPILKLKPLIWSHFGRFYTTTVGVDMTETKLYVENHLFLLQNGSQGFKKRICELIYVCMWTEVCGWSRFQANIAYTTSRSRCSTEGSFELYTTQVGKMWKLKKWIGTYYEVQEEKCYSNVYEKSVPAILFLLEGIVELDLSMSLVYYVHVQVCAHVCHGSSLPRPLLNWMEAGHLIQRSKACGVAWCKASTQLR